MLRSLILSLLCLVGIGAQAAVSKNLDVVYGPGEAVTLDYSQAAWAAKAKTVSLWLCSNTDQLLSNCGLLWRQAAPSGSSLTVAAQSGKLYRVDVETDEVSFLRPSALWPTGDGSKPRISWWSQFFVGAQRAETEEFRTLAEKHAPVLAFHPREEFFPATLDRLFDRPCNEFVNEVVRTGCAYDNGDAGLVTWTHSSTTDKAREFMRWNGHRSVRVFLDPTRASAASERRTIGQVGDVPAYWTAQKEGNTAWISYGYFYVFDQKRNEYLDIGMGASGGSHAVDRESITVEFKRQGAEWVPYRVIYAGHMPSQPTQYLGCKDEALCTEKARDKYAPIAEWTGGKVAVSWDRASRWGDSPIGYVAEGSHAITPARGWYFLNVILDGDVTEPAGSLARSQLRRSWVQPLSPDTYPELRFSGATIDGTSIFNSRIFPFVRFPISDWVAGTSQPLEDCFAGGSCSVNSLRSPRVTETTVHGDFVPGLRTRVTLRGSGLMQPELDIGRTNLDAICEERQSVVERSDETIAIDCTPLPGTTGRTLLLELLAPGLVGDPEALVVLRQAWTVKPVPSIQLSTGAPSIVDTVVVWIADAWSTARTVVWSVFDAGGRLLASFTGVGSASDPQPFRQELGRLPAGSLTVQARIGDTDLQGLTVSRAVAVQATSAQVTAVMPAATVAGVAQVFRVEGSQLPDGLGFMLDGCLGTQELPGGTAALRQFSCTFDAATPAGQRDGAIGLTTSPFAPVLKTFSVAVAAAMAKALADDFTGTTVDPAIWTVDGWTATGNDYTRGLGTGIGPVTVANGLVEFGKVGRISTKGKVTISGDGAIVIEGRMAGAGPLRDTSVMLVDTASGDQILMGDTNYAGWGFYAVGIGSYTVKEATTIIGEPSNPFALGGSTTAFMEYRLTIVGDRIKIERGPTLANITQTGTATLGRSVAGRSFHVSIGVGWAYYPGTWDWIRVKSGPPAPVLNAANGRRYEVIECGSWTSCRSAAKAKGGELSTVRSKAENDWLIANLLWQARTEWGLWIGLTDEQQEGLWRWTSGEPVTFTNWRTGEPNNFWLDGRPEAYVHMWRGSAAPTFLPGVWNDIIDEPIPTAGAGSIITQAIVEYPN